MTPEEILLRPPKRLSQSQRESYFENGYALIENVLDADRLARLRSACAELQERALEPGQCPPDFEFETHPETGERHLRQVLCAVDYHPALWAHASQPPMTELAADVVGPNVLFRESNLSFKVPGGRGFDWHQDVAFFPSSNLTPMMTLAFLEEIDARMGPTRVIPGSHCEEIYNHYDEAGNWLGLIGEHDKPRVPVERAVDVTGPAGSVLITNCAVVHAAGRNQSPRRRPMAIAGYAAADAVCYVDIPYRSRYRWTIVHGEPSTYVHNDPLRMKMPPDWSTHRGIRIDNLYQGGS